MSSLFSNHLKALLFLDDITAELGSHVYQHDCLTVQHFDYSVSRTRDEYGITGGLTTGSELHFTVKIHSSQVGNSLYAMMKKNLPRTFTLLFNATFDEDRKLSGYEDAMVVMGHVVEITSKFDCAASQDSKTGQIQMNLTLLVMNMTYVGKNMNRTLFIRK